MRLSDREKDWLAPIFGHLIMAASEAEKALGYLIGAFEPPTDIPSGRFPMPVTTSSLKSLINRLKKQAKEAHQEPELAVDIEDLINVLKRETAPDKRGVFYLRNLCAHAMWQVQCGELGPELVAIDPLRTRDKDLHRDGWARGVILDVSELDDAKDDLIEIAKTAWDLARRVEPKAIV